MKIVSRFVVALPLTACVGLFPGCDDAPVVAPEAPREQRVTVDMPQRKTLQRVSQQPGKIEAFENTFLHAKIRGYVDQVAVDIGDRVTKGQELIQLWAPEMKDQIQQKEALLAQAEAEVAQSVAALRAAEAACTSAEARIRETEAGTVRAEADYKRWKAEHVRINELAASGSVTRKLADETLSQFGAADAARQEAIARVESAKASVDQSRANIETAKADETAARARQRVAEANLVEAQTLLAYATIKAPYDGVVTRRLVDTGDFVQPPVGSGSAPLLVVCHADTVRIFVDVPEMDAAMVDLGDKATVRLQALSAEAVEGHVTRTSWDLEPSNRCLKVEIDLPNEGRRLRPGMYATASILLEERKDVLTVPLSAVVRESGQTLCCVVEAAKVRRVPIELGLRSGADVEVLSGLRGDEAVVQARADSLKDGQAIEVAPPSK